MTKRQREKLEIERRKLYAWIEVLEFRQARQHGKSKGVCEVLERIRDIEFKLAK